MNAISIARWQHALTSHFLLNNNASLLVYSETHTDDGQLCITCFNAVHAGMAKIDQVKFNLCTLYLIFKRSGAIRLGETEIVQLEACQDCST